MARRTNIEFLREIMVNSGHEDSALEGFTRDNLIKVGDLDIDFLMHCRVTTLVTVKRVMKRETFY